jgi:hypothetical protein
MGYEIAFLAIPLYFIGTFSFLNYQWVPQTLALIFFFLMMILFNRKGTKYRILNLIIFTAFVFTHTFIPVFFLLFMGLYIIKKREFIYSFLLMTSIYITVLFYYSTTFYPLIIETFLEQIIRFGETYTERVVRSFRAQTDIGTQILSTINRIRVTLVWSVVSIGFLISFIKKRINYTLILLMLTGAIYLGIGVFYTILGLRSIQILFIPVVCGIGFFFTKWRKLTIVLIIVILFLNIAAPMRTNYDRGLFLLEEEETASGFLANNIPTDRISGVLLDQVTYGFFTATSLYINGLHPISKRPGREGFFEIFDSSVSYDNFIIYNSKLGKEIITYEIELDKLKIMINEIFEENKIYQCDQTFIIKGIK